MNKYLIIENLGYEGCNYKSIESEKNKQELTEEFNSLFQQTEFYNEFNFYGQAIYRGSNGNYNEIVTLDEFWENNR